MHSLDIEETSVTDSIPDVMTVQDRRPPPIIPDFVVNIFTVVVVLFVSIALVVIGVSFGQDVDRAIKGVFKDIENPDLRPKGNHAMPIAVFDG
ncbi:hypothetical protein HPB50_018274 [Hyalomma asiaticum]|uniref:Uncharacterized protein n=1 Tax=Hyalomma asiaticum TaxID=266040 RepID=A0ACB7SGQ0_HYAAI|nr:hypothetical protein HPB50_018274 [Hyalomma asiaticum]